MFKLFIQKIICMLSSHKFSIEVAAIGVGGITLPELIAMDHLMKIMVSIAALTAIILKEMERRKEKKNEKSTDRS